MQSEMKFGTTFVLSIVALLGTLVLVWTGKAEPDVWETFVMTALPAYVVRAVGQKWLETKKGQTNGN